MTRRTHAFVAAVLLLVTGCLSVPEGIEPVHGFQLEHYLGTWYELARYDHRFERGLERVQARYTLRDDGGVFVLNRGFDPETGEWEEARARAYLVESPDVGHLKVSFFGPFYGSYVVFALDPGYRWAWVTGPSRDYLWLLSREPVISEARWRELLQIARDAGFDTDALLRVDQTPPAAPPRAGLGEVSSP